MTDDEWEDLTLILWLIAILIAEFILACWIVRLWR